MLSRADRLPTGDAAAVLKVANLCAGRETSADAVAGSAGRDVRFSAELLRLANSAFSAPREPIVSLPVAITRLGLSLVESLARAFSASGLLRGCPDPELAQRIHQHSVRTGVMAYAFADGGLSRDEALAAGLLQNTGLYLFAFAAPTSLKRLTVADTTDRLFYELEYETFGTTHAEAGAALASKWGFPAPLVEVMAEHDLPIPSTRIGAVARLADLVARQQGYGIEPPEEIHPGLAIKAQVTDAAGLLEVKLPTLAGTIDALDRLVGISPVVSGANAPMSLVA